MRGTLATGAVTLGFVLACSSPSDVPEGLPDLWAPSYAVADDPCGLAPHAYQAPWIRDADDDGAPGDTWTFYPDFDVVLDDENTEAPISGWTCFLEDGFGCVPHAVGRSGGQDVIGWLEGDVATDTELEGTLELTWGACVSQVDVRSTQVEWLGTASPVERDADACAALEGAASEPGEATKVHVVQPASETVEIVADGYAVGSGAWTAWMIEVWVGAVIVARDSEGCIDAWRVEHPEQVLVTGVIE